MAGLGLIRTSVSNLLDFYRVPQTHLHHKIWYVHLPTIHLPSRHIFNLKICSGALQETVTFWALKTPDPMNPVPQASMLALPLAVHCTSTANSDIFECSIVYRM